MIRKTKKSLRSLLGGRGTVRLRHYRGHGIHSPFVYALARRVFCGDDAPANGELYDSLVKNGVNAKIARQIERLHGFCGGTEFNVTGETGETGVMTGAGAGIAAGGCTPSEFTVLLPDAGVRDVETAVSAGGISVVVHHRAQKEKARLCDRTASRTDRLTIETRNYMVIFNQGRLPLQHYKL